MFGRLERVDSSRVIEIEFVADEPLEGWVRYVTATRPMRPMNEIRFSGWLGLLQAIVTLTGSGQAPRRLGGKLGARGDPDLAEDAPQV